jgi:hypothetical protein
MRLFEIPLSEIGTNDILALISESVRESRRLDFKRDLPTDDKGKADLASDVCSFANTDGGVILFGIEEGSDESTKGRAQRVSGIVGSVDEAILRLTQSLDSKISPSIVRHLRFHPVEMEGGQVVLALGISQSYARPHREEVKKRYLLRNDAGKYEPDVMETRRMFLESESWVEEAERFVEARLELLRRVPLEPTFAVLHVLPLGRLRNRVDLSRVYDRIAAIIPAEGGGLRIRPNLHGVCGQSEGHSNPSVLLEQLQVFRNGGVEFASSRAFDEAPQWGKRLFGDLLTRNARTVVRNSVRELESLFGLDAPFVLSLTIRNADGFKVTMGQNPMFNAFPISESLIRLPSVVVEAGVNLDASIRQLTDVLWEAFGSRHPYWPEDDAK